MKNIFSLKVSSQRLRLLNILKFYKFCQTCSSYIYIHAKDKSCKVDRLPSLVSFVLSLNSKDAVIVVEGDHAKEDKVFLESLL
jgi:arginine repressor